MRTLLAVLVVGEATVGGVLVGIVGFALARGRAFALRLQDQTALCQAQIEENTRPDAMAAKKSA